MNPYRRWLHLPTAAACLLAVSLLPAFAQSAKQPNIIFVFADDHAYQAISAYGSMINHTPNIDRLAREGMLFENCMVTNSICAPSRAVILTGKYSHLNGVLNNRLRFDGSQQTFPKLLREAGYQTAIIGKWHLKTDPTGFDYWEVLPGQGAYYNPDMRIAGGQRRHEGYVTNVITDLALDWFKNKRDPGKPFMVMYQHKAPHRNWSPGPEHLTLYDGMDIWEPPTLFDDYTDRASPARAQAMEIGRHMTDGPDLKLKPLPDAAESPASKRWMGMRKRFTESQQRIWDAVYEPKNQAFREANLAGRDLVRWKYQRYIKDYLRTIASIDDNLGRVLRYLDETGLADNTVVIYNSDQGFYLGEHGWFDKRWMYEESLRTPLIVRWPGVTKPGSRNNYIVSNVDFAETFLEIAGADVPEDMQGHSLVPQLKGKVVGDWRQTFYYHYYEGGVAHSVPRHYGVRGRTHKLIHYYETDEWELFDLDLDPHELHSVYGQERYALIQEQLHKELDRLRKELQVPEKDPDL